MRAPPIARRSVAESPTGGDAYSLDAYSLLSRGPNASPPGVPFLLAQDLPPELHTGCPPRSPMARPPDARVGHQTHRSSERLARTGVKRRQASAAGRAREPPRWSRRTLGSWTSGEVGERADEPSADATSESNATPAAADSDARFDHQMRPSTKMPRSAHLPPTSRPSTTPTEARANVQVSAAITTRPRTCIRCNMRR